MTARATFEALLRAVVDVHRTRPVLSEFVALPNRFTPQDITPHRIPAAALMETDTGLFTDEYAHLRDAFIAASRHAAWRETYRDSVLGADFLDRFACYCLVGTGGPYRAPGMGVFVVYMPAGLYYPFHHHPAEELYFIIAGQAEFLMEGARPKTLGPGETVFHNSNVPHATRTGEHPVMALVLWRGDMTVKPVLTHPGGTP